jgi:hypothetical protein
MKMRRKKRRRSKEGGKDLFVREESFPSLAKKGEGRFSDLCLFNEETPNNANFAMVLSDTGRIEHGQDSGHFFLVTLDPMGNGGIIVDAVPGIKNIPVVSEDDLHFPLQHINEFLAFVG